MDEAGAGIDKIAVASANEPTGIELGGGGADWFDDDVKGTFLGEVNATGALEESFPKERAGKGTILGETIERGASAGAFNTETEGFFVETDSASDLFESETSNE